MDLETINQEVGQRLRRMRLMCGLSQEEAGAILGVTFQQFQKYESGANRISAASLVGFCREIQMPLAAFAMPTAEEPGDILVYDPEEINLLCRWRDLDPPLRWSVVRLVEQCAHTRKKVA
ncbi:MAG: XRE family transcriptional regulator [Puniceicoccaceae bacterium 5H]|nr:MAG: XRE family transcriptional regulator [Puniceicoccaceae bacterium 5H]